LVGYKIILMDKAKPDPIKQKEERLLTLEEAAQYLNCHPNTLRNLDNDGVLTALRFGKRGDRRYRETDLINYLNPTNGLKKNQPHPLESNHDFFEAVFNQTTIGIVLSTLADGRIVRANPSFFDMFGYAEAEVIGKTSKELQLLADYRQRVKLAKNIRETGKLPPTSYKYRRQDGQLRDGILTATLVRHNGIDYIITETFDITRNKNIERKLKQSEINFKTAFEQAAVGMAHVNFDGRFIRVNRKLADFLGYTPNELVKRDFKSISHPDDRHMIIKKFQLLVEGELDQYQTEQRYLNKDGLIRWMNLTASVAKDNTGKPLYFVFVLEDITRRKEVEAELKLLVGLIENERQQYKAVFEQMPSGVVIAEAPSGKIIFYNNEAQNLVRHSLDKTDSFEDYQDYGALHEDGTPYTIEEYPTARAILKGETVRRERMRYRRGDGTYTYLAFNAAPIIDRNGQIIAAVCVYGDITEAIQEENRKDEFIAVASHELKTPITSIKAYAQIIKRRFQKRDDQSMAQMINRMDDQVTRLVNLVNDLLDIGKIQSGQLLLDKKPFNFHDLINRVVEEVKPLTRTHTIQTSLPGTPMVLADRTRLRQVITNLLVNAIKYSPQSNQVVIKTKTTKSAVTLSIQDFGVGIPPEVSDQIFNRFYRITNNQNNPTPGLGLGLFISREIMKAHQGDIWVKSKQNQGSTFFIKLPLTSKTKSR
jgi:PAS domain S-box-containing protein/excisionase family DNA binding protein